MDFFLLCRAQRATRLRGAGLAWPWPSSAIRGQRELKALLTSEARGPLGARRAARCQGTGWSGDGRRRGALAERRRAIDQRIGMALTDRLVRFYAGFDDGRNPGIRGGRRGLGQPRPAFRSAPWVKGWVFQGEWTRGRETRRLNRWTSLDEVMFVRRRVRAEDVSMRCEQHCAKCR